MGSYHLPLWVLDTLFHGTGVPSLWCASVMPYTREAKSILKKGAWVWQVKKSAPWRSLFFYSACW